ncbi:MAG: acyl-CoA dehydrogenase family protein [Porticoccaceae bacterium]
MDFGYNNEEEGYRLKLKAFLDENLTEEIARQNWEDKGVGKEAREFSKKLAAEGLLGMSWPVMYGGQGLPQSYDYILLDELGRRWGAHVPLAIGYTMVGHTILRRGSEEMKKLFIPRIVRGEIEFGLGYTEPNSGSDLASMKMSAIDHGDYYLVNGQKTFNTESHYADFHWLAARTNLDSDQPPHKCISLFIVDQNAPGITIRPLWTMSGERTNEVYYDNVEVPKDRLVGEENKGFYYMMEALGSERNTVFVPTRLAPILNSMVQYVQEFSDKRLNLSINPQIREKLAQIAIEIEVAQVLAERSRWIESSGGALTHQPEVTKIMVSELQQRMMRICMEILGPFGQLKEGSKYVPMGGRIEWNYLHSFMTTIGGGTSEVGRNVIAQRGLNFPR